MSSRTTILLLLLVAAGLAYLLFVEDLLDLGTTEQRAERARKALDVDVDDVVAFRLERHGETAVLERGEDERWRLVEPVRAEADGRVVERLLHAIEEHLRKLGSERVPQGDLAAFGLDAPSIRIELRTRSKSESLSIGNETPAGGRRWLRIGESDEILVVDGAIHAALDRSLLELRDRSVFGIPAYRVDRLEIRGPGRRLLADRTEEGWSLEEPVQDLADRTRVEEILYRLNELEVAAFLDAEAVSPGDAGLAAPKGTVTIVADDGTSETLEVGAPVPGIPGEVHARRDGTGPLLALDASILDLLDTDANGLRDRSLWPSPFPRWSFIEIGEGAGALRVEADDPGYRITHPEVHPADRSAVEDLEEVLRGATVRRFVPAADGETDRARFGLDPGLRIRLGVKDGEDRSIRLGGLDEDERFAYVARGSERGPMLAVDRVLHDRIPRTVLDLRSREIAEIDLWEAESVRLERPDRTYVARAEGFTLRIEEPLEGAIDPDVASGLEESLRPLRASRLFGEASSDEDLAGYGLAPPVSRLAVRYEGDGDRAPLAVRFGNPAPGGGTFAVVEGDRLVFSTSPELAELLRAEWIDRRIFANVRPSDVSRIRIVRGEERLHLIRRGESWEAKDDGDAKPDPKAVARLIETLLGPVVDRYLVDTPDAAASGLDAPAATVSVEIERDASVETRTLRFGASRDPGERFALLEGRGGVFLVRDEVYDRLRVTP